MNIYENKKVLLIAGGGTLGTYTAKELLEKGAFVDVICLEDKQSDNERLTYYKEYATIEFLTSLFEKNHYDGIVNFIYYKTAEEYAPFHSLLIKNTEHLIFLSSYRVYADEDHPITESAKRLSDVIDDPTLIDTVNYAMAKIRCEDFLTREHMGEPWTIVRPVISFSYRRFDLFTYGSDDIVEYANKYGYLYLPSFAKSLTAGLDWAGNSGKLIANLLFKKDAIGNAFTISSGNNLTWGEVADIYADIFGFSVKWCDEETFLENYPQMKRENKRLLYLYDRKFNRLIDNSRVLAVTGLKKEDFLSVRDGILIERAIMEEGK